MKSSRLLKVFEDYIKKIDMNNAYATAKYFHSLKSMDLARHIASELCDRPAVDTNAKHKQ